MVGEIQGTLHDQKCTLRYLVPWKYPACVFTLPADAAKLLATEQCFFFFFFLFTFTSFVIMFKVHAGDFDLKSLQQSALWLFGGYLL